MYVFGPISTEDILKRLSSNYRLRRLERNISRKTLAKTSDIPLSAIQLFGHTGAISLTSFMRIIRILGYADDMMELIGEPKYPNLDEVIRINKNKNRERGTDENV